MKVFAGCWLSIVLSFSIANAINVVPSLHYLCSIGQNVDCTSHIFGDHKTRNESCNIKFHPVNSTECSDFKFKKLSEKHFDLGSFHFKPFSWNFNSRMLYNYTLFNLNFTNIKWDYLKFRFEVVNDTKAKVLKNHCREITISGDISDRIEFPFLNYDCQWSEQSTTYENSTFTFEYEAEHLEKYVYEKLLFKVPLTKFIDGPDALPFFYINLTNAAKLDLYGTPQTANDFTTVFLIEKCFEIDSKVKCEPGEVINVYKTEIYSYTPKCTGLHYFKITPIHETCPKSHCPSIITPKIYYEFASVLYTILWNALWILLISGICFSLYWLIKRHQKFTPKILLLHPDADKVHMDILYKLSKYFEIEYGWMVVWNKEIELTQHGDPYIWCLEAFMNSNTVIYIDKPSDTISNEVSGNVHMHLQDIFFKILKTNKRKKDMKFFNIMLDSHDPGAILPELREFNTFYLPSEWQPFVRSIKRQSWIQKLVVKLPTLSNSTCGKELLKAFNQS